MALQASTRVHDAFAHYYLPKIALLEKSCATGYHTVRLPLGGKSMADTDAARIVSAMKQVKTEIDTKLKEEGKGGLEQVSIPLFTELQLGGNPHLTEEGLLSILDTLAEVPICASRLQHISLRYKGDGAQSSEDQQFGLSKAIALALKKLIIVSGCLRSIDFPPAPATEEWTPTTEYNMRTSRLVALLELNDYPKVVKAGLIAAYDNAYHLTTLDFSESLVMNAGAEYYYEEETFLSKYPALPATPQTALRALGESEEEGTVHSNDYQFYEGLPPLRNLAYNLQAVKAVNSALCSGCVTIVRLDFSTHCIGDVATRALCQTLEVNTSLTELSVNSCNIGTEGGMALVSALDASNNQSLTELNAHDNHLNDIVAKGFLDLIVKQNTALGFIGLDENCISQKVMSRLSEELMLSTQPVKLKEMVPALYGNLSRQTRVVLNQAEAEQLLTDTSARVLLHALRNNTQVVHVDLSNNELTDDAAIFLAQIIEGAGPNSGAADEEAERRGSTTSLGGTLVGSVNNGSSVKKMILQSNRLTNEGAKVLLAAVSHNEKLELLDLRFQSPEPGISSFLLMQIALMVELNKHPRDLRCRGYKLLINDPDANSVNLLRPDPNKKCTNDTIKLIRQIIDLHRSALVEEVAATTGEVVELRDTKATPGLKPNPAPPAAVKRSASSIDQVLLGGNSTFVNSHAIPDLVVIADHVSILDLSATMLDESEFVQHFVPSLKTNTTLTHLDISKNTKFTDLTIGAIVSVIRKKNNTILQVKAHGCPDVSQDALDELVYVCGLNQHIQREVQDALAAAKAKRVHGVPDSIGVPAASQSTLLSKKPNFKTLLLAVEAGRDQAVTEIVLKDVEVLGDHNGVTSHQLKREYDDESCRWIVRAMTGNSIVNKIDLTGNALTDASAPNLCALVKSNISLTTLNISYNHFTDEGLTEIGRALKENATLKVFVFAGNRASPNTVRLINLSMSANVLAEGGDAASGPKATNVALYSGLHSRAKPAVMTVDEHAAHLDKVLEQAILQDALQDKERAMRAQNKGHAK